MDGCILYLMHSLLAIDLDESKYIIKYGFSVPDEIYEEDVVVLHIHKTGLPKLMIHLKNVISLEDLNETLLYTNYFMRNSGLNKMISCLTDSSVWHILTVPQLKMRRTSLN